MSYRDRHPDVHQEEDIVPRGRVIVAVAIVMVVSAVLVAWTQSIVASSFRKLRPKGTFDERTLGPRRIVSRVRQDLFDERGKASTLRERQMGALDSYGWVDEAKGIVRIPIERAMEIVVEGEKR